MHCPRVALSPPSTRARCLVIWLAPGRPPMQQEQELINKGSCFSCHLATATATAPVRTQGNSPALTGPKYFAQVPGGEFLITPALSFRLREYPLLPQGPSQPWAVGTVPPHGGGLQRFGGGQGWWAASQG